MAEWETLRLGSLGADRRAAFATGPFGSAVSAKNFRDAGVPMLRGSNLSTDVGVRLDDSEVVFVSEEIADQFNRSLAVAGDLVFTCWGTIGQLGLIEPTHRYEQYLVSNKQMKMTPDPMRVCPLFLYYYLSQPRMIDLVRGQSIGSSVPGFNLGQLKEIPVVLPEVAEQRAIAKVLGALDEKTAANNQIITIVDELAKFIWHREAAYGMAIPLSSLARFVNGKAFTNGASGTGRVVVRIAELNSGLSGSTVYSDIEVEDDHLARPGDLLFAWSGSLTVARWFRPEAIVNQHIFKVIPIGGYPMWLVNQAVRTKLDEFRAIAADKATTMGHIQRRHLDEPVVVPIKDGIDQIDNLMEGLWNRALAAERENLSLVETRDELLPLLMSGKVSVRDVEKIAEETV